MVSLTYGIGYLQAVSSRCAMGTAGYIFAHQLQARNQWGKMSYDKAAEFL